LFGSVDAAAINWGLLYNDNSIQSGKEFGSSIYQVGNKFAYSKPRVGTDEVDPSPAPSKYKTVAYIHSHAKFANGNEFSDADKNFSNLPVYLATPMGALLLYPSSNLNDGIYQFLPSDPDDPLRRNSIDYRLGPKDEPTWGFWDWWNHE
jgi:hypothetical protein